MRRASLDFITPIRGQYRAIVDPYNKFPHQTFPGYRPPASAFDVEVGIEVVASTAVSPVNTDRSKGRPGTLVRTLRLASSASHLFDS